MARVCSQALLHQAKRDFRLVRSIANCGESQRQFRLERSVYALCEQKFELRGIARSGGEEEFDLFGKQRDVGWMSFPHGFEHFQGGFGAAGGVVDFS